MSKKAKWLLAIIAFAFIVAVCSGPDTRTDEQKHQDKVSSLFSPVDGSNRALVRQLKANMNDPESFEHVGTTYYDLPKDSMVVVQMAFRAKNGFGAYVLQQVDAQVGYDGTVRSLTIEK